MPIRLGVVMDPIESIAVGKDTTLAMLLAATRRGWKIHYMLPGDLYSEQGVSRARMRELAVQDDQFRWYEYGHASDQALQQLDIVLMRRDPPFDMDYIYSTYLLEQAQQAGTLIVNDPRSLRDCNEKMFATRFPQCCPAFLVSSCDEKLRAFHARHGDVIFKPLDGMGGTSVFRVTPDDPNLNVIIETLTVGGRSQIMAQRFLPEIASGDKRILLIEGRPVEHCLARVPQAGESRGNLAAGGTGMVQPLSKRDRWICDQLGDELRARGLWFVGLDVIGDYLTEINVTSPTCVREIDNAQGTDIAGDLLDCLAKRLNESQAAGNKGAHNRQAIG